MNLAEIASQKADVAGLVGGARSELELPEISPARGAKGTGDLFRRLNVKCRWREFVAILFHHSVPMTGRLL